MITTILKISHHGETQKYIGIYRQKTQVTKCHLVSIRKYDNSFLCIIVYTGTHQIAYIFVCREHLIHRRLGVSV